MSSPRVVRFTWFILAAILISLTVFPTSHSAAAPAAQSPSPNWYSLAYEAQAGGNDLQAIGLDAQGNGWLARRRSEANPVNLLRLQQGRVSATNPVFTTPADTRIDAIRLSAAGSEGWAIGAAISRTNSNAAEFIHYTGGAWQSLQVVSKGQATPPSGEHHSWTYDMVLDSSGTSGWAVGLDANDTGPLQSTILRLANGTWSYADDLLPSNILFTHITADASLTHVWAAGIDQNNGSDAALYYLEDGKWVSVSQPIGHYSLDGLAVDGSGNGWAIIGGMDEPANSPAPTGLLRLHPDGSWTLVKNNAVVNGSYIFSAIALDPNGNGWVMGHNLGVGNRAPLSTVLRLQGDNVSNWQVILGNVKDQPQRYPIYGQPLQLAISANGDAWAITYEGFLLHYGSLNIPMPALATYVFAELDPATVPAFPTGYELHGPFLTYWQQHGGLRQFGLPISAEIIEKLEDGKEYIIQYTERARFEYHPANPAGQQVQLGLLGDKLAAGRQNETPFQRTSAQANPAASYFDQTGHNMIGPIKDYWLKYGGLPVFGYPISEQFEEKSPTDGKTYLVQYFERNRLEYHPENSDPQYKVLLGLLGTQQYQRVYSTKPLLPTAPESTP